MGIGGMCGQDELGEWVGSFCDAGGAWAGEWTTGLGRWAAAGGYSGLGGRANGLCRGWGTGCGLGGMWVWWSTSARVAVRVSQSAYSASSDEAYLSVSLAYTKHGKFLIIDTVLTQTNPMAQQFTRKHC